MEKITVQTERRELEHLMFDVAKTLEQYGSQMSSELYDLCVSLIQDASELLDREDTAPALYLKTSNTLSTVYTQALLEIATYTEVR